jgi:hypothetical protein
VLAQEDWEVVCLPAIACHDETIVVDSLLGPRCFERRRGEALHPAREPLAMLEQIRRPFGARVCAPVGWRILDAPGIGEYNFAGQYQQAPSPLGGGLVKAAWFRHLHGRRIAGEIRAHRAELGHRQQGDRAQPPP